MQDEAHFDGQDRDTERHDAVRLLDPTRLRQFRRAARLAAVATRFSSAAVTFPESGRQQQLITHVGLDPAHFDLMQRCCEATSRRRGVHVITNLGSAPPARADRFEPRFFAGIAIRVTDGIGVLGVMGPSRSTWVPAAEAALIEVHAWLEDTLEALRIVKVDHLTRLPNRRELEEVLDREWRRATRDSVPLSVLSIDIDHFKGFNDTYGHPRGDEALQAVAAALRGALMRPADVVGRMGGEEFLACLPQTGREGARTAGEAMRRAVEELRIGHVLAPQGIVTVSIGCATAMQPGCVDGRIHSIVAAADRALYQAKAAGRNEVVSVAVGEEMSPPALHQAVHECAGGDRSSSNGP